MEGGVLIRTQPGVLAAYDNNGRLRLNLEIDSRQGFARRAGMEFPRRITLRKAIS
jgi:hypothetical protein